MDFSLVWVQELMPANYGWLYIMAIRGLSSSDEDKPLHCAAERKFVRGQFETQSWKNLCEVCISALQCFGVFFVFMQVIHFLHNPRAFSSGALKTSICLENIQLCHFTFAQCFLLLLLMFMLIKVNGRLKSLSRFFKWLTGLFYL